MRNLILFCVLFISITAYTQQLPVAINDNYSVHEDSSLTVTAPGVLNNDYDPDGDPVTGAFLGTDPSNGHVVLDTDGSFIYTPDADFNGADSFTYNIQSISIPSTQTFTVDQSKSILHVDIVVKYGDIVLSDSDNSSFTGAMTADLTYNLSEFSQIQINEMDLLLAERLSFTLNFFGSGVNIDIPAETVHIEMKTPGPPAPVAAGLFTQTGNTIGMSGTMNVSGFGIFAGLIPDTTLNLSEDVSEDISGTIMMEDSMLHLNIPINIDISKTEDFEGISISFAITINNTVFSDAALQIDDSDPATVLLTVNPVNDAPIFNSQPVTEVTQDQLYSYTAMATDVDEDSLSFRIENGPSWLSLDDHKDGTATLSGVPTDSDVGDHDVTVQVEDGLTSTNQSFMITVLNANNPPSAQDITCSTLKNLPVEITLMGYDPDGDSLSYSIIQDPANGTVLILGNIATYTPELYFFGTDSFTYQATDSIVASNEAKVTINVEPGTQPFAEDDSYSVDEDTTLIVQAADGVLANDTDAENDSLSAVLVSSPLNGSLTLNQDGSFTYTPAPDFNGQDSLTYKAFDGAYLSNEAKVIIQVKSINDPPLPAIITYPPDNAAIIVEEGSKDPFVVEWQPATDPDNDEITYTLQFSPSTAFTELILSEDVGSNTRFETDLATIASLFTNMSVLPGDSVKLYQRVVSSDSEFEIEGKSLIVIFIIYPATHVTEEMKVINQFKLAQNYPNPFNPVTRIVYVLPSRTKVLLKVNDAYGREVMTLVNEVKPPGSHEVILNASSLPSGVYVYRIEAGEHAEMKKLILLK